jgi:hypothetical protein
MTIGELEILNKLIDRVALLEMKVKALEDRPWGNQYVPYIPPQTYPPYNPWYPGYPVITCQNL